MEVLQVELPLYRVHYYNEFVYRVIKFKRSQMPSLHVPQERTPDDSEPDGKFSQSYSRAKNVLLQLALCNRWDYFITVTLDAKLHDRYNVNLAMSDLVRWMIEYRREYDQPIKYVLIPELHEKGGVHFHGFISGIRPDHLSRFISGLHPRYLVEGDYYNFGLLAQSFGYVTLLPVKNPIGAAFYMTKYITKHMIQSGYYEHIYTASRGLNRSRCTAYCYAFDPVLESYLQGESDFCCYGWAIGGTVDWTFPFSVDHAEIVVDDYLSFSGGDAETIEACVSAFGEIFESVQIGIEEYLKGGGVVGSS